MPNTDTRWISGTLLAVGAILFSQNSGIRTRVDDLRDRVGRLEDRVEGMDARLRGVEIAFAKVDQRLATLDRVRAVPAEEPPE